MCHSSTENSSKGTQIHTGIFSVCVKYTVSVLLVVKPDSWLTAELLEMASLSHLKPLYDAPLTTTPNEPNSLSQGAHFPYPKFIDSALV